MSQPMYMQVIKHMGSQWVILKRTLAYVGIGGLTMIRHPTHGRIWGAERNGFGKPKSQKERP